MSYTALPTKNPGDLLTSALWNTYLQGNADSGFMRKLADSTLVATAASVDFTSIPATFAHLMVVYSARCDAALTVAAAAIRFNGDAAGNYDYQRIENSSATAIVTAEGLAQLSGFIGYVTGANGTGGKPGGAVMFIPNYAGTTFEKDWLLIGYARATTATGLSTLSVHGGTWRNAGAINRITILPPSGNFIAGSRFTILGIPA